MATYNIYGMCSLSLGWAPFSFWSLTTSNVTSMQMRVPILTRQSSRVFVVLTLNALVNILWLLVVIFHLPENEKMFLPVCMRKGECEDRIATGKESESRLPHILKADVETDQYLIYCVRVSDTLCIMCTFRRSQLRLFAVMLSCLFPKIEELSTDSELLFLPVAFESEVGRDVFLAKTYES